MRSNTSRTRTTSFPSPFGGSNTLSASAYDPLAASTYMEDEADPWSGVPTPSRTPALAGASGAGSAIAGGLASIGGGALGRLMNGMSIGAGGTVGTSNLIGQSGVMELTIAKAYRLIAHLRSQPRRMFPNSIIPTSIRWISMVPDTYP